MTAGFSKSRQLLGLAAWVAVSFVAAGIGSVATMRAQTLYLELQRPAWSPPGEVFGPVWTVLYTLMGIAAWLVWRVGGFRGAPASLTLFLVQLAVNALWSWLFFGWRLGAWSFTVIIILWGLILSTLITFWRVRPPAGALLVPYLLWVSFALALNYTIWQLNPRVLGS